MTLKNLNDKIIITKKIEYDEIMTTFEPDGMNKKEQRYFHRNKIHDVQWYEAKIPNNIIKNVILSHHPRCQLSFFPRMLTHLHNKNEMISKHGATVEETCNRLQKFKKYYEQKRLKCIKIIKNYNTKNFRPIILTQIPINSRRQKKIRQKSNNLICYDGLHRLLSLYYPEKINFDYVKCFIAVSDENKR